MPEFDDIALLKQYADGHSEAAFAVLVERYVHLVYSTALRRTGNPSHAEEITQAVFIILTQKAKSLGPRTILSGWLYQTARLTAANFLRSEIRRQQREQEAYMESLLNEPTPNVWQQIAPLLDDAMGHLSENDRNIVVLRFFQNKSAAEIGDALGIDSSTAQKRITRAVGRLRDFFAKHRVAHPAELITGAISTHSVQTAPALLAKSVTAAALVKGAAVSSTTLTLVKATLIAMKTKTIVATVATTIIVAGIATWFAGFHLFHQPKAALPAATPTDSVPMAFANAAFKPDGDRDGTFVVEVDPNTLRTSNSAPAIHIKGPVAEDGTLTNGGSMKTDNSSSTKYWVTQSSVLFGKHIRITGWLKTSDVKGWGSAFMIILGLDGTLLKVDSMGDRPIYGTTGWQQVEFVTDVPKQPCIIYFGPDLYGPGELWGDDFQINLAPSDAPVTDDSAWHQTMSSPGIYSEDLDFHNLHNGHHTVCLAYTPGDAAPRGAWTWWGQKLRGPDYDKYIGHTMRMTGWIKTENVSGHLEPTIRPWDNNKNYGKDSMTRDNSLKGTRDWTKFTVTCAIPDDTQHIDTAFIFYGSGKVWIDTDSLKFDIVK
jgi:RNA polymerase sigma factor (sigma-70 family)